MIAVDVRGVEAAVREFDRVAQDGRKALARGLYRAAADTLKVAKRYAPISPTIGLLRKFTNGKDHKVVRTQITFGIGGKRGTSQITLTKHYRGRMKSLLSTNPRATTRAQPGALRASLTFGADADGAKIYVPVNSPAGKYAYRIHWEKFINWFHRGPGTQASGAQADHLFITRAIKDNNQRIVEILRDALRKAVGYEFR